VGQVDSDDEVTALTNQLKQRVQAAEDKLDDQLEEFDDDMTSIKDELQDIRNKSGIKPPLVLVKPAGLDNLEIKKSPCNINSVRDISNQYESLTNSDLIMAVLAGIAGVATSWALRYENFGARKIKDDSLVSNGGILADIHDGNYRKGNNPLLYKLQEAFKHPDNPFDNLEGAFHRLRYGHDIFNWNQTAPDGTELWAEMVRKHGGVDILPFGNINRFLGLLNTIGRYLALYTFDSFSKQGLPLPFSSYLNKIEINELGETAFENRLESLVGGRQDIYDTFLTIKARDIFGTALTTTLLGAYRKILEKKGYKISKNQKYYEMNCIAYFIVFTGCLGISAFDLKTASMNYPSLAMLLKNVFQLNTLVNNNRKIIDSEYQILLMESVKGINVGKSITELIEEKNRLLEV
jgi:hypothetical protein